MSPESQHATPNLITALQGCLKHISTHEHAHLAGPKSTTRRASVALIVRIQPSYNHWPVLGEPPRSLDDFFAQDWVQNGEPQILFIKRAARTGDRWTSHIALPGGKRDLTTEDDKAAAIRETHEEVGIDLSKDGMYVGNLAQRVVTTQWGAVPLMVLCPFVFLLVTSGVTPRLQPTEVASAHWVAVRDLLTPELRTHWHEDVSNRLAKQETGVKRRILRSMVGMMTFGAIELRPFETYVSFESPQAQSRAGSLSRSVFPPWRLDTTSRVQSQKPLLLWGLTLGVMTDFLYLLPPHTALELWAYPTFTHMDVRFVIWAMTHRLRRLDAENGARLAVATSDSLEVGELTSVSTRLDGYYPIVRRAVALTLMARAGIAVAFSVWLVARWRRRS